MSFDPQSLITNQKDLLSSPVTDKEIHDMNTFYSNTDKRILVADVDEIIVNITPKWVKRIYEHRDYFDQVFNLDEKYVYEDQYLKVLYRPDYFINNWLLKPELRSSITRKQKINIIKHMNEIYDTEDFYDDLEPTSLGMTLANILNYNAKDLVDKLVIISKVVGDKSADSKVRFLKELFTGNNNKVDIYLVDNNEKKSDALKVLKEKELNSIASVYEDEPSNIADLVMNGNLNNTQIYMPSFNYNRPNKKFYDLLENNGCQLIRFDYLSPENQG